MTVNVEVEEKVEIKEPSLCKVVLLNDNHTPMDFVVEILIEIFDKSVNEAQEIMLHIHEKGKGIAGAYMPEIARSKASLVLKEAAAAGFPLKAVVEED